MTIPATLPPGYFDAMYQAAPDPWGFEDRWYEQRKYALSLALLPAGRYRGAFEPGCSIGVLTVPVVFEQRYASGSAPHPHVHGANLGIRASAYLAAGGFRPLRTAEDHALLAAATQAGCSVVQAGDITVETSGRQVARAPCGFSNLLRALADRRGYGEATPPPAAMRSGPAR